jgi:outer membrane protein OmpA-like peptidoglycan-associated protein
MILTIVAKGYDTFEADLYKVERKLTAEYSKAEEQMRNSKLTVAEKDAFLSDLRQRQSEVRKTAFYDVAKRYRSEKNRVAYFRREWMQEVTGRSMSAGRWSAAAARRGDLHLKQQGTSITGCCEPRQGLVEDGIEGKAVKFTWYEKSGYSVKEQGTAIMVLSPDGKQMFSLWSGDSRERRVLGTKKGTDVGSCPHWGGGVEAQLAKDLEEFGRARVYGINFDSDSVHIKDESKPTLDKIASILKAKAEWKITIEGHTDSTSTPEHNQQLSEKRAQAVKNYLTAAELICRA